MELHHLMYDTTDHEHVAHEGVDDRDPTGMARTIVRAVMLAVVAGGAAFLVAFGGGDDIESALRHAAFVAGGGLAGVGAASIDVRRIAWRPASVVAAVDAERAATVEAGEVWRAEVLGQLEAAQADSPAHQPPPPGADVENG